METPAEGMPPGWTNDPALLEGFFDYDSGEAYLARCHGLNDPKLLLMTTPDTGDMGYIITSGGRFYWGDLMIDHIAEITKPKTWPAILRALATQGEKGLRMKFLRPVKEVEEEPQEEEIMVEGQGLSVPSRSDVPSTSENLRDIIADITSRPGAYGVPPENVANLVLIHQDITRLRRPDGPDFLIPPPPHDREVHPNWPSALEQVRLRKSTYDGVEYWALPDLLGLFMSSLVRAPTAASKRNFYLPLTAVYRQWCAKLIRQGRHNLPRVFQCSWTEAGEFHLGASRGAFAVDDGMGSWLEYSFAHKPTDSSSPFIQKIVLPQLIRCHRIPCQSISPCWTGLGLDSYHPGPRAEWGQAVWPLCGDISRPQTSDG